MRNKKVSMVDQDDQQPSRNATVTTQAGDECRPTQPFTYYQYGSVITSADGGLDLNGTFEIRNGDSFARATTYGDETHFQTRLGNELWQGSFKEEGWFTNAILSLHEFAHGDNAPAGWLHLAAPNTWKSKEVAAATLNALGVECVDTHGSPTAPHFTAVDIYQLGQAVKDTGRQ